MELEREAVSDRIHSKRSEPSDVKSDGRHGRATWPAEGQEVVYKNKEYMVDFMQNFITLNSVPYH